MIRRLNRKQQETEIFYFVELHIHTVSSKNYYALRLRARFFLRFFFQGEITNQILKKEKSNEKSYSITNKTGILFLIQY